MAMVDLRELSREKMFAVVLVWNEPSEGGWVGWLTTTDHQAQRFVAEDLREDGLRAWLAALPGWESDALTCAVYTPGAHLVWRGGR